VIETRSTRLLALLLLASILCGLLVWAGTLEPDPARNEFPDEDDFAVDYTSYIGDRIKVGGTVLATNPVVIEASPDGRDPIELTLTPFNQPDSLSVGDDIVVYGTLEVDNTIAAINTTARQPWESQYMYLVSFLAGLWTLGRFIRHWRLNTESLSFTPREVD
jgi:hypothetical protein